MDNLYIIKIGGNIIDNEAKLHSFLTDFSLIHEKKILIHGGGKLATELGEKMGIEQQLVNGRRITDAETLKLVTMVYAGLVNKNIVAQLQSLNCNAMGLSGADANSIMAHKRLNASIDYGYVGDVDEINVNLISNLMNIGLTLVFAPITHNNFGQLLNTNADTIAREIALSLASKYYIQLIYCFEKQGVLLNEQDELSVIPKINFSYFNQLKSQNVIHGGMLPKLENAFSALNYGVHKVIIGKAEELLNIIEGKSGTMITNED